MKEIIQEHYQDVQEKIESEIVKGLKLHGYSFEERGELYEFVSNRCNIVEVGDLKMYYVDNQVFFVEHKTPEINKTETGFESLIKCKIVPPINPPKEQ